MIGTGTLIVPGMPGVLADGLDVGIPVAGRLIAAFALTVAIGAPLLAGATSRIDRRKLLVAMQVAFVAGHLLAAFAPDYRVVLIARVASASSAALFTSQAAATTGILASPARRGHRFRLSRMVDRIGGRHAAQRVDRGEIRLADRVRAGGPARQWPRRLPCGRYWVRPWAPRPADD